jgi:hypothetical protein
MDKVYEQKDIFVRHELLQLVQAIDKKVLRLEYRLHKNGMETVTIVWLTESGEVYKPINVTADSLLALARDVLKYID